MLWLLVTADVVPSSPIFVTLMMEASGGRSVGIAHLQTKGHEQYVPPKRQLLQEPHRIISQKMAFFKIKNSLGRLFWEPVKEQQDKPNTADSSLPPSPSPPPIYFL
jgi:hypothetical protein